MIEFDVTKENIKERKPRWPQIPDHLYSESIIGGSRPGKSNSLFNLINQQTNISKFHFYAKDSCEAKVNLILPWKSWLKNLEHDLLV